MTPKKSDPAPRAVGYIRVSTGEQAREGWSLSAQRRRVSAYCEGKGWRLVKVYADEGVSGSGVARPAFDRMVRDVLADGVSHVVALKLDRLGRSAKGLLDMYLLLEGKGVGVTCIDDGIDTSTAQGRLFRTILAAFSEFERDVIRQRTKTGLAAAQAAGTHVGRAPYGWTHEAGRLVKVPEEQAVRARLRKLHRQGWSYNRLAGLLNAEGVPPVKGVRWHAKTVSLVLARK